MWRCTVADTDRLPRLDVDCFDCGGDLIPVSSEPKNGGRALRAILECRGCRRRWTLDATLTGHPKGWAA